VAISARDEEEREGLQKAAGGPLSPDRIAGFAARGPGRRFSALRGGGLFGRAGRRGTGAVLQSPFAGPRDGVGARRPAVRADRRVWPRAQTLGEPRQDQVDGEAGGVSQ
jgi:hypothetical protein